MGDNGRRILPGARDKRQSEGRAGRLALCLCLPWLAACVATVAPPGPPHHAATHALDDPASTPLGAVFEAEAATHPGLSGFDLIASGRTAFEARYGFARLARRTIDAQYFLWADDSTGRNMLLALIEAADRGVRVRLLLDDLGLAGADATLALLAAHPNVQVRIFNPFAFRELHLADFLFDFGRVNHRMHNKAFVVDNTIAVVGGRNITNQYFSTDSEANFRDLDLLIAGRVVQDLSQVFDDFWNGPWAQSIHRLDQERPGPDAARAFETGLRQLADDPSFPFKTRLDEPSLDRLVASVRKRLIWGKASLLADRPDKPQTSEPGVIDELRAKVGGKIVQELLVESAYFVPAGGSTERLCDLAGRGVRVRILTNSLASTDEISTYAGFMRYREALLRCGVELHELRPDAAFIRRDWTWLRTPSAAELHTKAAVFDRATVMIGSFNLDPRSRYLNTEIAVLVESPALAAKVAAFIEAGMSLGNSFRLSLDAGGDVEWTAQGESGEEYLHHSPVAGPWRRLKADFLSLLPIEEQL
jgi:putative cardiolipin synthase